MIKLFLLSLIILLVSLSVNAQRTILNQEQTSDEAIDIPYDNASSGLTSTNVQAAIDEIDLIIDSVVGSFVVSFNGRTGVVVPLSGDYTTDLVTEASNLYYTQARFDSAFAAKSTTDLSEGSNLYWTETRFDSSFGLKTTDDLTQGSSNFYYSSSLFDSDFGSKNTDDLSEGVTNRYYSSSLFDADLGGKTTTDLAEGSNLYWTQGRFDTAFTGKDSDDLSEGSTNLFYTEGRFDSSLSGKTTDDLTEGSNLYYTEARVSANSDVALNTTHRGLTNNPHSTTASQVGAYTIAQTDTAISTAVSDHEAAIDPHSQYLTQAEGDGLYYSITNPSNFETPTQLDARDVANRDRANHTNVQPIQTLTQFDSLIGAANSDKIYTVQMNGSGTAFVTRQEFEAYATTDTCLINSTGGFAQFLSLSFTAPVTGNYHIYVFYSWSYDDATSDFEGRIQLDGVDLPRSEHIQEPKDVGGTGETCANFGGGTDNSGTNQRYGKSYSKYINVTTGAHTIDLDFASGGAGGIEATIYGATISIKRVKE